MHKSEESIAAEDAAKFLNDMKLTQSTLQTSMTQFVNAVTNMEETVMVPSMLRDIGVICGVDGVTKCPPPTSSASLYHFYNMLRTVKTELSKGPDSSSLIAAAQHHHYGNKRHGSRRNTLNGHVTVAPTNQITPMHLIDANSTDKAVIMVDDFRSHMTGLLQTLNQLTITAQFVTKQYSKQVGDN